VEVAKAYASAKNCKGDDSTAQGNKIDTQRLALGGGVETGVVDIYYVVT